jgi:hypothetical protein
MTMKILIRFLLTAALILVGAGCADLPRITTRDVPRMEPEALISLMKDSDTTVIDIRLAHSWQESSRKIKGACREVGDEFSTWESKYDKDKTVVLYCA